MGCPATVRRGMGAHPADRVVFAAHTETNNLILSYRLTRTSALIATRRASQASPSGLCQAQHEPCCVCIVYATQDTCHMRHVTSCCLGWAPGAKLDRVRESALAKKPLQSRISQARAALRGERHGHLSDGVIA